MLILKVRRVMISFLSLPVYRIGYQVPVFIECHVNDLREFRMVLYYNGITHAPDISFQQQLCVHRDICYFRPRCRPFLPAGC